MNMGFDQFAKCEALIGFDQDITIIKKQVWAVMTAKCISKEAFKLTTH